jgi:hypothetical protein
MGSVGLRFNYNRFTIRAAMLNHTLVDVPKETRPYTVVDTAERVNIILDSKQQDKHTDRR